ncbi:MAG TPA: hypothetical protein VFH06_03795 [Candidatus Saccharimonadales bacterium]|nr:hypothetical protein [Candidatus Saccharimonadales bacterium]
MSEPRLSMAELVDAIIGTVEKEAPRHPAGSRFDVIYEIPEYISDSGIGMLVMLLAASPQLARLGVRSVISHNEKHTFERLRS